MSHAPSAQPPRFKERIEVLCAEMIDRGICFSEAVEQFERCFIQGVLARTDGHLSKAATDLGIHRNTLAKRISKYKAPGAKKPGR